MYFWSHNRSGYVNRLADLLGTQNWQGFAFFNLWLSGDSGVASMLAQPEEQKAWLHFCMEGSMGQAQKRQIHWSSTGYNPASWRHPITWATRICSLCLLSLPSSTLWRGQGTGLGWGRWPSAISVSERHSFQFPTSWQFIIVLLCIFH